MPLLGKIALSVLTIPYSNAAEKRLFSMIKIDKTELGAIMVIKTNSTEDLILCHKMEFPKELLERCKSACWQYDKEHGSY